jgi:hypothetical protein
MSAKHIVDRDAAQKAIFEIDAAERKLRMLKQYINPETGTVRDMQIVSGLFISADDCMKMIQHHLAKFKCLP